ncbi:hypothetical protein [Hymenobacter sp. CRA2]|uniref:hypothetical protein n=1 Tax=Hymenobacter sp. CRA2 TaxID=1955620 RepID=UPI00098ECC87|nr:hypothetical protein [Hymenobacter sp. CRA2]OON66919.1 hypothetical protein B0919_20240 [Hymenobacter sp. CRA2]
MIKQRFRSGFLWVLCLPLLAFAIPGASWATFDVDSRLSVELPAGVREVDVTKVNMPLPNTRLFMAQDTVGLYQVIRIDMSEEQGTALQGEAARQRYYDGVVNGAVNGQQEAVLLARTSFPTAAGEGIELKMRARHKGTGKLVVKYSRSLLLNHTGYAFLFIPLDKSDTAGISGRAERERFFTSIKAKAAATW